MRDRRSARRAVLLLPLMLLALFASLTSMQAAKPFADPAFRALWERTFLWDPASISGAVQEPYAQSPGSMRLVQYFDKSRMEMTWPGSTQASAFATDGLLVIELMTGRIQIGGDSLHVELPNATVTDGVLGTNSYLLTDRSNEVAPISSLVRLQGNALASIDLNVPLHAGPIATDARDFAAKVSRRLAAGIAA